MICSSSGSVSGGSGSGMRGRLGIVVLLWLLLISSCGPAPVNRSLARRHTGAVAPIELRLFGLGSFLHPLWLAHGRMIGKLQRPSWATTRSHLDAAIVADLKLVQKGPAAMPSLLFLLSAERLDSEVHAAHAAARRHAGRRRLLLRQLRHHGFGCNQECRD
jgi:hypothetical protein